MLNRFLDYLENKSPVIIYHRGYSSIAPENTISAFDLVLSNGGFAIEFDVRLSKDNEVIILHDKTINRTSSGSGKAIDMTYEELKKNDYGSWFSEKFRNEKIPLLSFLFYRYKNKFLYDIELKSETSMKSNKILCEKVLYEIKNFNLENNVLLTSFNRKILKILRNLDKNLTLGLLIDNKFQTYCLRNFVEKYLINAIILNINILDNNFLKKIGLNKKYLLAYTVNNKMDYEKCIKYNIKGIITDNPNKLL